MKRIEHSQIELQIAPMIDVCFLLLFLLQWQSLNGLFFFFTLRIALTLRAPLSGLTKVATKWPQIASSSFVGTT